MRATKRVRLNGCIANAAILTAAGVGEDGKRHIPGVSVSLSVHEVNWRDFHRSLVERGLTGVRLVISDPPLRAIEHRVGVSSALPTDERSGRAGWADVS